MVDPTKGVGPVQNISSRNVSGDNQKKPAEAKASDTEARDEVKVAEQAVSEKQAQASLQAARDLLGQTSFSLGLSPGFITDSLA